VDRKGHNDPPASVQEARIARVDWHFAKEREKSRERGKSREREKSRERDGSSTLVV